MVEQYAREHAPSSDEESAEMQGPAPDEELFICSGPWNALHSPTRSSCLEFEILYGSDPEHALSWYQPAEQTWGTVQS